MKRQANHLGGDLRSSAMLWAKKDPTDPYKAKFLAQVLDMNTTEAWIDLALEMLRNP